MRTNSTKLYVNFFWLILLSAAFTSFSYGQTYSGSDILEFCSGNSYSNTAGDVVDLKGVRYDYQSSGHSTWFYSITSGAGNAISHVVFELGTCMDRANLVNLGTWDGVNLIVGSSLSFDFGTDNGGTGIYGIKIEEGFADGETKHYFFTLNQNLAIAEEMALGIKAGNGNRTISPVCGPSATCASISSLPVELIRFTATPRADAVRLQWETATESGNDFFQIEHSPGGGKFSPLAKVEGAGDSQRALAYSYIHENAPAGINYYRLKQVDFDGTYEYSEAVIAKVDGKARFRIYPNPAHGQIKVQGSFEEPLSYGLFDSFGRLLLQGMIEAQDGAIGLSTLPGGIYYLQLENERGEVLARERVLRLE